MRLVGIDIDGTLAHDSGSSRHIGELKEGAREFLTLLRAKGYILGTWSCRPGYMVIDWLVKNNIHELFEYINDSPLVTDDRKALFHAYIDNRAVHFADNWATVIEQLDAIPYSPIYADTTFSSQNPDLMLRGTGISYLDRFREWRQYWPRPVAKRDALLTICSHAKPYAKSHIHASIRKALHDWRRLETTDYIHISNAGVIPTEAGNDYPFNSYDWDDRTANDEVRAALSKRMVDNLTWWKMQTEGKYERIFVYLRDGKTRRAALEVLPEAIFVEVKKADLPYVLEPDADDCLAARINLNLLISKMENL